jgi:hypothetical protein
MTFIDPKRSGKGEKVYKIEMPNNILVSARHAILPKDSERSDCKATDRNPLKSQF